MLNMYCSYLEDEAFYLTFWNLNKNWSLNTNLSWSRCFSNMLRVHLLIRIGFHATTCVRNITFTGQGILLHVATAFFNSHIIALWCPQRRDVLAFMVIYPVTMQNCECLDVHGTSFSYCRRICVKHQACCFEFDLQSLEMCFLILVNDTVCR